MNLLYNGNPTYISVFDICQIYEDTSGKGQEGVRIIFHDDTYTFVEGPLDKVMYAIDEVLNPDWYKEAAEKDEEDEEDEEPRPVPDEIAARVSARILKRFCESKECYNCIFCGENKECTVIYDYPYLWNFPEGE